jgi:hypothetical protein
MVEEPSTVGAASALLFDQGGQSRTDRRVLPSSFTPIHPIPIVRTPIACDFRVSQTGGVRMGGEVCLTRTGGGRGKHLAGFPLVPVPVRHPPCRFVGVSPVCPGAKLHPGEAIQATKGRLTYPGAVVIGPTSYFGVELVDQGCLGPVLTRPNDWSRTLILRIIPAASKLGISLPDTFISPLETNSEEVGSSSTLSGESDPSRRSQQ